MAGTTPQAATDGMQPVVTISASYGAGGSLVAPALAARLGVALVDRLLTADVSEAAVRTEVTADGGHHRSAEGLSEPEQAASPGSRFFAALARSAAVGTLTAPPMDVDTDTDLRERAEAGLAALAAGGGGVVLGRAAAVLLADRPNCLHVRLDGPASRRIAAAARIEGIDLRRAADRQAQTDRARVLWVKRLYRADPTDASWYHLWLDTTVLGVDDVVDTIALVLARLLAHPGEGA